MLKLNIKFRINRIVFSMLVISGLVFFLAYGYFITPLKQQKINYNYLIKLSRLKQSLLQQIPAQKLAYQQALVQLKQPSQTVSVQQLAHKLQQADLKLIDIQPTEYDTAQIIFTLRCSGQYVQLLHFLQQLLLSDHYAMALTGLVLTNELFVIQLRELLAP